MELLADMIGRKKPPKEPILIPPKSVVTRASSDLLAIGDEAVVRTLRLIREKAYEPVQIEDIARQVALSRRMLEKRFKAAVGRSPYAEVLRLRLEKAKMLLADTNMSVAEVAEASGFGQAKQLHPTFTREVGMTPSTFRKSYQHPR
jgi:LacI family transcriptional regulator